MLESLEFLASLTLCLVYIAVPVSAISAACYFLGGKQKNDLYQG